MQLLLEMCAIYDKEDCILTAINIDMYFLKRDPFLFFIFCQNEDRVLWKLGTLPPGLLTFYKLTHPLDKSWHVLGLGYNPSIDRSDIDNAAVVHYNGNMKPWLELAMTKYRPYWTKYIKYDHPYIRSCNLSE